MAAGYHDWTPGEKVTASNMEEYLQLQTVMRFASASARNEALSGVLTEGLFAYLVDTNSLTVYSGAAWSSVGPLHGALTAWTPIVTQSNTPTLTVSDAWYQRIGRLVHFSLVLSITSSGTASNEITISLPVTAESASLVTTFGRAAVFDDSAGFAYYGDAVYASTTTMRIRETAVDGAAAAYAGNGAFSAALATDDVISANGFYKAGGDA